MPQLDIFHHHMKLPGLEMSYILFELLNKGAPMEKPKQLRLLPKLLLVLQKLMVRPYC